MLRGYIAQKLLKECPSKSWNERSLRILLNNLRTRTVQLTGVQGAADRKLRVGLLQRILILLVTSRSVTKVRHRHISQYGKFKSYWTSLVVSWSHHPWSFQSHPQTSEEKIVAIICLLVWPKKTKVRSKIMHALRSYEFQDIVCQIWTFVQAALNCTRKPSGQFWDTWCRAYIYYIVMRPATSLRTSCHLTLYCDMNC